MAVLDAWPEDALVFLAPAEVHRDLRPFRDVVEIPCAERSSDAVRGAVHPAAPHIPGAIPERRPDQKAGAAGKLAVREQRPVDAVLVLALSVRQATPAGRSMRAAAAAVALYKPDEDPSAA